MIPPLFSDICQMRPVLPLPIFALLFEYWTHEKTNDTHR